MLPGPLAFLALGLVAAEPGPTLRSPDRQIAVTVRIEDGQPHWDVVFGGRPVVSGGRLGVETPDGAYRGPFQIVDIRRSQVSTRWTAVWGELRGIPDRYEQAVVLLKNVGNGRMLHLVVRAYNEGVGLRYHFPVQGGTAEIVVKNRLTEYRFLGDWPVYQCRNYQYGSVSIDRMSRSEGAVTVDVGDGALAALTDADRADFPVVFWHNKKGASGTIVGRLHSEARGRLPFNTSWEVLLLGTSAGRLCENRFLVENLSPPCAVRDTSWIRPGKAICQVRNARLVTAELKPVLDFASAQAMDYLEIDHSWCGAETKWTPAEIAFFAANKSRFWNDKPEWRNNVGGNLLAPAVGWVPFRPRADSGGSFVDLDIADLVAHGNRLSPKVGVCVRGEVLKEFGGEHAAEDVFAAYEKWGLAGIKLGFVPCSSQANERALAAIVRCAAAHKLIVCIHDAYLPAGLSRTYPNLVNVEGLAGEEAEHSIPLEMKSRHDVMLPFTRGLMGPLDYTPEFYKRNSVKTHCHQVAMLAVYHGRASIRGGVQAWSPGGSGGKELDFVRRLPGLFDQRRVYGKLGEYVTVARRRDATWYVASMGDGQPRTVDLPLDFLDRERTYRASLFSDTPQTQDASYASRTATSADRVTIRMEPNGGHLMILEPLAR